MTLRIHRYSIKRLVLRRPKNSTSKLPKPGSGKELVENLHKLPRLTPEDLRDLEQVIRDQRNRL